MKLFVTGAGGFLGSAVVRRALAAGHQVTALVHKSRKRVEGISQARIVTADLAAFEEVTALLADFEPDVVIHCAWRGLDARSRQSLDQFDQVETCWRLTLAAAAAGAARFVGIGSQDEYGPQHGATAENCLPQPVSAYGAAKLAAAMLSRQAAAACQIGHVWLRLFAVYGPGDGESWMIPKVAADMLANRRPQMTAGTQLVDYLYIDDAAEGVIAASTHPEAHGIYNLSSGMAVTVREIVELLRNVAAPDFELVWGEVPFRPDQVMHIEGVNDKLRALGWVPHVSLRDGIVRTVEALRTE